MIRPPVISAGLLIYREGPTGTEVFLVHPGGPFWRRKDLGSWSIPKGLCEPGEDPLSAACREFTEETGFTAGGPFTPLGTFPVRAGKMVSAWAAKGDPDPSRLVSTTFSIEWPPRSGRQRHFPEVDRGAWFAQEQALEKITPGQRPILTAFYSMHTSSGARPMATLT